MVDYQVKSEEPGEKLMTVPKTAKVSEVNHSE